MDSIWNLWNYVEYVESTWNIWGSVKYTDEAGLRYHYQLWPGLQATITDSHVSDAIGRECSRHLLSSSSMSKVSYKILFWRNFISAILIYWSDIKVNATHQQCYIDTAMMHTTVGPMGSVFHTLV